MDQTKLEVCLFKKILMKLKLIYCCINWICDDHISEIVPTHSPVLMDKESAWNETPVINSMTAKMQLMKIKTFVMQSNANSFPCIVRLHASMKV